MTDELLERASRALREATDGRSERAGETRVRLLAEAHRTTRSRKRIVLFVLPLAAALAASSAWAAATGRIAVVWEQVQEAIVSPPAARAASAAPAGRLARSVPKAVVEQPSVSEPAASSAASALASSAPAPSASGLADPDQETYLVAHRAHFGGGNPAAALQAWDRYLRLYPSGRFALEARYNRALCLVNLGRKAEAASALEPFARGAWGSYRQAEARALREALGVE